MNPDHLWLGTKTENAADKVAKERQARGESIGMARLTTAQVIEIRQLAADSSVSFRALARQFGVTDVNIAAIVYRRTWRHVGPFPD